MASSNEDRLSAEAEECRTVTMGHIRVLIADDHGEMRDALKFVLDCCPDIEVVGEARDGQEAIQRARQLKPDAILMDLNMPHMDGLSATRQLKQEMPTVRVLILTLYDEWESRQAAIASGADGFLAKGPTIPELVSAIRQAVRGQQGQGSSAATEA